MRKTRPSVPKRLSLWRFPRSGRVFSDLEASQIRGRLGRLDQEVSQISWTHLRHGIREEVKNMRTYESREAAKASRWAVAKSLGCRECDLVVVRAGDKFAIRTRESLEKWLASKSAA